MTPNLKLELLAAGQSQKHVTMNEALAAIDSLAQLAAIHRKQGTPPVAPAEGATYIVPAGATGAFAGRTGTIAVFSEGSWRFHEPVDGWRCYVTAEEALLVYLNGQWKPAAMPALPTVLGVNASADADNRLALQSPASLFDHAGAGHRLKINKAAAGETASILLQDGYSGRAEIGLTGDDNLRIKVSDNGQGWKDALVIERTTGLAQVQGPPVAANGIATKASVDAANATYAQPFDYQLAANQVISQFGTWVPIANLATARIASPAFNGAQGRFAATVAGTYAFVAQIAPIAGASGATISASATRNGTPAGNVATQILAANQPGNLSLLSLLALAPGDTAGLAVNAQAAVTISQGLTSVSGYRI